MAIVYIAAAREAFGNLLLQISLLPLVVLVVVGSFAALARLAGTSLKELWRRSRPQFVALSFLAVCVAIVADKPGDRGGAADPPRSAVLPDAGDVGEGFAELPSVTNLSVAAILRGSNSTDMVVAWPVSARPAGDLVDVYAGTNLLDMVKILELDISSCMSNALLTITDEDLSGTNSVPRAFFSVGDSTDTDGDGLSDSDERFVHRTNPTARDTDGDFVPDGEEVASGTCPTAADTDGDGLSDGDEAGYVYTTVGPIWQDVGSFVDMTDLLSTSSCWMASVDLPYPVVLQGVAVSNVSVSVRGAVFFNRSGRIAVPRDVGALDFSRPVDAGALVVAPFSDSSLCLRTNATHSSSVKVGTVSLGGRLAVCVQYKDMGRAGAGSETNNVSFQVIVPLVDGTSDAFVVYRDVVGEEMDGRNAGVGFQTFGGRGLRSVSYMEPGSVFNHRVHLLHFGADTDPTNPDTDGDGIADGEEADAGTSPLGIDTDGDGLPDDWELSHGLDPLSPDGDDGAAGDPDEDGLSNLDEYLNDSDPQDGDTDDDGIGDAAEVAAGSNPSDGSDNGQPPDESLVRDIEFNIAGDWAAWEMKVEGLGPHDTATRRLSMVAPSVAGATRTLSLRKGNSYRISVRWLNCGDHDDDRAPWYCWSAQLDGAPTTSSYQDYSDVRLPGNEIVVGDGWIAENADGLLTSHVHESARDSYGNSRPGNVAGGLEATLYVLGDPVLVFDYDRDGSITDAEAAIARAGDKTFRFWVNDDNDSGDVNSSANDIPGSGPDHADGHVDGSCDFLDFTPVWIDTRAVFPSETPLAIRAALKWRVRSDCVNVMWSELPRGQAGMFQRAYLGFSFGRLGVETILAASVTNVSNGVEMSPRLLSAMRESQDCGVFLVEGCAAGTNLVVEGWVSGDLSRKVVSCAANVSVSSVEDMYRHLNTRGLSGESLTWFPSTCDPTNRPDSETSSTNLVFVHGANVTQQGARAWASEVFKRMWQSGMTAKFTAVTWRGDIGTDWNYQENVSNAFFTASVLAPQVAELPGTQVLMAHSLGNMVCSSMIQDYDLVPACYLMCNSAVPAEAYDTDEALRVPQLVHPEWTEYPTNSWAARWHWLFRNDTNDDRKHLGWPGRFSNVSQYAVNFYSTGDEILELVANNNIHTWTGIGSSWGHYSWHKQELFKGRGGLGGTSWSGWNIEEKFPGIRKISVSQAQGMAPEDFKTNTVFYCYPPSMNQPTIPLLVRGAHLAQGIPALTPAAGRMSFGGNPMLDVMVNMNTNSSAGVERPNGWPERSDYQGQWCHSDIKDVSYFFNHKFYDIAIEKGALK